MELEIVDNLTKQVYKGTDGITYITNGLVKVNALKIAEGEYIVEKEVVYTQVCIVTNIHSIEDLFVVIRSLIPSWSGHFPTVTSLKGYKLFKEKRKERDSIKLDIDSLYPDYLKSDIELAKTLKMYKENNNV